MFPCQDAPVYQISAHYNELWHGYGVLPRQLGLNLLNLLCQMGYVWSVVLWSCHFLIYFLILRIQRTDGYCVVFVMSVMNILHLIWIFLKQGKICTNGDSHAGVESSINFEEFMIQSLLGNPEIIFSN